MIIKTMLLVSVLVLTSACALTPSYRYQLFGEVRHGQSLKEIKNKLGSAIEEYSTPSGSLVLVYSEDAYTNDDIYCQDVLIEFDKEGSEYIFRRHNWLAHTINQRCSGRYQNHVNSVRAISSSMDNLNSNIQKTNNDMLQAPAFPKNNKRKCTSEVNYAGQLETKCEDNNDPW